jgi:hypothetical protein
VRLAAVSAPAMSAPIPSPAPVSRRLNPLAWDQAKRLLDEGWEPYPFTVGAICWRGIHRPTGNVQQAIWQAMRQIIEKTRK